MKDKVNVINDVKGSIVSDQMLNKVDMLTEQAKEIGRLQGELTVAENLLDNAIFKHGRELEEATKKIQVVVKERVNSTHGTELYRDHWGNIVSAIENARAECFTTNIENLKDLADAIVKGEAKKEIEEAQREVKTSEAKVESYKKQVEQIQEKMKELEKTQKESTEQAIERAERNNISTINDLNHRVKVLEKEADLMFDEKQIMQKEKDLALEAQNEKIKLLEYKIKMLESAPKNTLQKIQSYMNNWNWRRQMHKLTVSK